MKKISLRLLTLTIVAMAFVFSSCEDDDDGGNPTPPDRIVFSKANNADPTLEANQDRITPNVWITRGNTMGIFNAAIETTYSDFSSPADTEWAFGTTADIDNLTFDSWEDTISASSPNDTPPIDMLNRDMVVHLITDDIYLDIRFTQWASGPGNGGPGGGGFTYERSEIEE